MKKQMCKLCKCLVTIDGTDKLPLVQRYDRKSEKMEMRKKRAGCAGPLQLTHTRELKDWVRVREFTMRKAAEHAALCPYGDCLEPFLQACLNRVVKNTEKAALEASKQTPGFQSQTPTFAFGRTNFRLIRRLATKYGHHDFALRVCRLELQRSLDSADEIRSQLWKAESDLRALQTT